MPYKDKEKQKTWQREYKKRRYQILKNDVEYMEKKREQGRKDKRKYAKKISRKNKREQQEILCKA